jgi:2-hydroxychromene-2-carboxylate isomerase
VTTEYDLHFYFDPVCPFAWLTSKWVRTVAAQRDYSVDWRFISLRILNAHMDYASHFPPEYEDGHTAGLRLLRVAARVRAQHGRDAVGPLYEAIGNRIFDTPRDVDPLSASDLGPRGRRGGSQRTLEPLLRDAGLPTDLAEALDDQTLDDEIRAETEEALALTGRDVGTPILHFQPPGGTAFFGPVISRLPGPDEVVELWDHVVALASFPGFAEIKRSLRERPQLAGFGVDPESVGKEEDWHGGSRRTNK